MKHLLILIFMSFLTLIVKGQLGNYDQNGEVKILSQKTWLKITYKETEIKSDKEVAGAILGAILAPIVDIGIAAAKEKAKQNAAKYKSSFVVTESGSGFWISEKKINLPVLTIIRKVLLKENETESEAMKIILEPELSPDKTAFRFIVKSPFNFVYSSAKTRKEYDYIDITLDIKFKALIVNKSIYEIKDLRATTITIPMNKVGATSLPSDVALSSGWMPFPTIPTLELETDVTEQETKTVATKGTKDGKPVDESLTTDSKSLKKKGKDKEILSKNSGLFEFEITVTETNPYKIKSENTQKLIEASGDASGTLLKTIIESIFKKAEEKKEEKTKEQ